MFFCKTYASLHIKVARVIRVRRWRKRFALIVFFLLTAQCYWPVSLRRFSGRRKTRQCGHCDHCQDGGGKTLSNFARLSSASALSIGKFGVTITPNLPIWADSRHATAY